MTIYGLCHCSCCYLMGYKRRQRELCNKVHLRSYLTSPVRWRMWVQSDSWLQSDWMWGCVQLHSQWGNKSCLYLKETNASAVLSNCRMERKHTHAHCMFYGSFHHEKIVFTSPSGCNETVKLSGEKKTRQEKTKDDHLCLEDSVLRVSLVQICSAIAASKCVLNACYQFSVPSEDKGIQGERAWHTRLQQDGPAWVDLVTQSWSESAIPFFGVLSYFLFWEQNGIF